MSGPISRKSFPLFSSLLASISLFAQVAPQQYPQDPNAQVYSPQGAADGGDQEAAAAAGPGIARISLLEGDVSVRRGDSGDYVAAAQNAPVMVQDSLQVGNGGRAEVQFDAASMIRMAQSTEVRFTDLQPGHFQMQLGRGTVTYRVLRDSNDQVEIDTPSVSIRPAHAGVYRVTVTDDGQTYVTPRTGQVEVFTPKGSQMVQAGQTLMARGPSQDPEFQMVNALNRDEWDAWSESRDRMFQQAWANTSPYIPQGVYGAEDLAGQGQWVNTPDYGYAWEPPVGPDWSPYSVGRWAWEDYYGWTWVSADPWGWAPFHYGRWFYRGGLGWLWWPGRIGARAFWSPAMVGFFGFGPGAGFGFGFGRIGWVPLAPFEAFHPWYGRGGLGNRAFINNTNITNVYRNARVGNGVVAVNAQQFGHGATGYSRLAGSEIHSAAMLHGSPATPTAQSMRFSDRSTNTTARTNFSQSRFATHMTPSPSQRTPFGQQPRSFGGSSTGSSTAGSGGWNRYNSSGQNSSAIQGAHAFGNTSGTRNLPQSSSEWNRFGTVRSGGAPAATSPTYRGGSSYGGGSSYNSNGRSQLQVSPPLVRERGNYNSAPRYSTPNSAPRYSAPSTPHYSAPSAPRSAPSGGGGRSSGGGGGHSSGGGGGHR